jgi:hypothetical protein
MGFASSDNGYLAFDHYRQPKSALLNKFWDVDNQGKAVIKGDPRMLYAVMMRARLYMLSMTT